MVLDVCPYDKVLQTGVVHLKSALYPLSFHFHATYTFLLTCQFSSPPLSLIAVPLPYPSTPLTPFPYHLSDSSSPTSLLCTSFSIPLLLLLFPPHPTFPFPSLFNHLPYPFYYHSPPVYSSLLQRTILLPLTLHI